MCVPKITHYNSTVISILSCCLAQPDPNGLLLSSIFSTTWQQLSRTLGLILISSSVPFGTFLFRVYETYGAIILIAIKSSHLQVRFHPPLSPRWGPGWPGLQPNSPGKGQYLGKVGTPMMERLTAWKETEGFPMTSLHTKNTSRRIRTLRDE